MDLARNRYGGWHGLDLTSSIQGQVAGCCERRGEPFCSIRCGDFLDQLRYQLLKNCASCSRLVGWLHETNCLKPVSSVDTMTVAYFTSDPCSLLLTVNIMGTLNCMQNFALVLCSAIGKLVQLEQLCCTCSLYLISVVWPVCLSTIFTQDTVHARSCLSQATAGVCSVCLGCVHFLC